VHDVGLKDMIEAVYLTNSQPDIHLFTISVEEIKPMTVTLSSKVAAAIPLAVDQILDLAGKLTTVHP
jgi:hydrogenase maturation protease